MTMPRRTPMSALEEFGEILFPDDALEPILAGSTRQALLAWLEEIWSKDDLKAVGLKPRTKCLLKGPPGCGKTTLAHHLAQRLDVPMAVIEAQRLRSKWVNQTGMQIGAMFDAAARWGGILFIDEFDSIGGNRIEQTSAASGEHNHSVNTVLRKLEAHEGIVIAATNLSENLDPAVWRRFELQIDIDFPDQVARERILNMYLSPYGVSQSALTALARDCKGATPALLKELCEGMKRSLVLGERLKWDMSIDAVLERILLTCQPHPDLTTPALWTMGGRSRGAQDLDWPLELEGRA
ncbi:MAG: ATP-binding protein [Pseudomonadota bacterium]